MNSLKNKLLKNLIIISSVLLGILLIYFVTTKTPELQVQNYSNDRDREFIFDAFKKDEYWLVAYKGFDIAFMLDTFSPRQNDPQYYGKLNIKVLLNHNKPVGFTTYYKKKFYEAQIQFLYVDNKYRGKGYAKILIDYVLADLKKQGVLIAKLVTYINNTSAIKVYNKLGFKEVSRDEKYVSFEKKT